MPTIKWLRDNWFLLAFVFASGSAYAWQEVQRQELSKVVVEQHQILKDQRRVGEAVIRLQAQQGAMAVTQGDIKKKLDLLIELQLKRTR